MNTRLSKMINEYIKMYGEKIRLHVNVIYVPDYLFIAWRKPRIPGLINELL